jgi:hypothetical protein
MSDIIIWQIGPADLLDTYKTPLALGEVSWLASAAGEPAPAQCWPLYHPSEADPEAGYRLHPYTVHFALDHTPAGAYALHIDYLTIAPRLAHLELRLNGVAGLLYPRPQPSRSGEIRLLSGLHTTIYADGAAEVILPAALLREGANELVLTARDDGEQIVVDNVEAIKRLDRMANGAGLIYQAIRFVRLDAPPPPALGRVELVPTVLYSAGPGGELEEQCYAYVELGGPVEPGHLYLSLNDGGRDALVALDLPAAAFGHLRLPFALPDGEAPTVGYNLRGAGGAAGFAQRGELRRRRKWRVYITPHAHTDIGYTHRQWEVAERLCRTIDAALDTLAAEEAAGAAPAFAYHLDAAWALEHYLATRDAARRKQLLTQLAARRIGLAANYVDLLTQYAALEDQIRNAELSEDVLRPHGLRARFAAVVDVASLTGSMPDLLAGAGVRYLVHANNQDRGPFRLNGGLHRRSPFYWEGRAGGRVLVWLAKMYCELRKVCGSPPLPAAAERGLDMWLAEYERDDYAPDAVLLYGQEADNTDLDPQPAEFVRRWNERYAFPRLIPCDVAAFFEDVEQQFGERLETLRGDGGAYWEDGAGSTIVPAVAVRQAQAALPAAERLEALAVLHGPGLAYPAQHYDAAWRQILLFDEHTWGAFLSCTDPEALLQQDQWATKEHMARDAAEWARRLLHGAAARHSLSWNSVGREVVVYNPHSWPAGDRVHVEVARGERAYDASGAPAPMRVVSATATQQVVELWVEAIPGLSYRRFALRPDGVERAQATPVVAGPLIIENEHYRLGFDVGRGVLVSWHDKALGRELVDAGDAWGLGQLIHAAGGEGTRLVSNQADLPDGDPQLSGAFELLDASVERSELGVCLRLRGRVPHGELEAEWLLPAHTKRLDVAFSYRKDERREKEAVYIAFPLALPGAAVRSDSQLGWVDWHREQLPGGCKEWLPLQSAVLVERPEAAVLIASPAIPLFCVGDVVRGRWPKALDLTGGRIFSYVLNNYWHTNYKASQGGPIRFGYRLTSAARFAPDEAFRFGWAARRPPYAQRMSYQDFRDARPPYQAHGGGELAYVGPEQVHLSTLKPARYAPGWVARFQEIGGGERVASLALPGRRVARAWCCDLLERDAEPLPVEPDGSLRVPVPAWGLATVRFELEAAP